MRVLRGKGFLDKVMTVGKPSSKAKKTEGKKVISKKSEKERGEKERGEKIQSKAVKKDGEKVYRFPPTIISGYKKKSKPKTMKKSKSVGKKKSKSVGKKKVYGKGTYQEEGQRRYNIYLKRNKGKGNQKAKTFFYNVARNEKKTGKSWGSDNDVLKSYADSVSRLKEIRSRERYNQDEIQTKDNEKV